MNSAAFRRVGEAGAVSAVYPGGKVGDFCPNIAAGLYVPNPDVRTNGISTPEESWLGKFAQIDKWSFWPTASKIAVEQERR